MECVCGMFVECVCRVCSHIAHVAYIIAREINVILTLLTALCVQAESEPQGVHKFYK